MYALYSTVQKMMKMKEKTVMPNEEDEAEEDEAWRRKEQQASEANRRMHSAKRQHKHLTQATFGVQRGYTDRSGCTVTGALRKVKFD